jgi:hypothetical protein
MTLARFGLQATVVLTLGGIVSFPEQRQVSAGAFSTNAKAATSGRDGSLEAAGRLAYPDGRQVRIGYGSVSEYALGAGGASAARQKLFMHDVEAGRRPTPRGVLALGGRVNAIVGYAQLRKAPIPFARVVLRNVATGLVEARAVADERGRFTFLDVLPSEYVLEVIDRNGAIIMTSDVIGVGINDLQGSSLYPASGTTLATFGGAPTPAAQETVAAASSQGVSQVAAPARCASPPCSGTNP